MLFWHFFLGEDGQFDWMDFPVHVLERHFGPADDEKIASDGDPVCSRKS